MQRVLKNALSGRTSLIIAHRLSTVRDADLIVVVDKGMIVEQGSHDQLLAINSLYAELYRTQFGVQDSEGERLLQRRFDNLRKQSCLRASQRIWKARIWPDISEFSWTR